MVIDTEKLSWIAFERAGCRTPFTVVLCNPGKLKLTYNLINHNLSSLP